jgi:hypothetical protein
MSGNRFANLDPAVAAYLLLQGEQGLAKARTDIEAFAQYVIREERKRKGILMAPHQKIGLAHMWAHTRSVQIWPVNHAKTTCDVIAALFAIGTNPNSRGAIVSETQAQSGKLLRVIREYIDTSEAYRKVFPHVRRGKQWTDTALTVQRDAGIKDPTVVAIGVDGGIAGARLDWIIVDDILSFRNTRTKEQRDRIYTWLDSSVLSRFEGDSGHVIVTNSAWHPDDVLHRLSKQGWGTLRMQVDGGIFVKDDAEWIAKGKLWDHSLLEATHETTIGNEGFGEKLKLKGQEIGELLWKNHPTIKSLEELRMRHPITAEFNRLYMSICRDDDSSYCKVEWIEQCKSEAYKRGYESFTYEKHGANTFTGVDLAVSPGEESDDCALFTFEVLPDGKRLILDIDVGKYDGPTMVKKIVDLHRRYDCVVRVENNGAQSLLLHFLAEQGAHVPVKGHHTGRNKAHPEHGVMSLFTEMAQGLWLIPSDKNGRVNPATQRWIDECLYYVPSKHTGDVLMSSWLAREQARAWGMLGSARKDEGREGLGVSIMMR